MRDGRVMNGGLRWNSPNTRLHHFVHTLGIIRRRVQHVTLQERSTEKFEQVTSLHTMRVVESTLLKFVHKLSDRKVLHHTSPRPPATAHPATARHEEIHTHTTTFHEILRMRRLHQPPLYPFQFKKQPSAQPTSCTQVEQPCTPLGFPRMALHPFLIGRLLFQLGDADPGVLHHDYVSWFVPQPERWFPHAVTVFHSLCMIVIPLRSVSTGRTR